MKYKRIISILILFATLFSIFSISVHASGVGIGLGYDITYFGDLLRDGFISGMMSDYWDFLISDDGCLYGPNHQHVWENVSFHDNNGIGRVSAFCHYCGEPYSSPYYIDSEGSVYLGDGEFSGRGGKFGELYNEAFPDNGLYSHSGNHPGLLFIPEFYFSSDNAGTYFRIENNSVYYTRYTPEFLVVSCSGSSFSVPSLTWPSGSTSPSFLQVYPRFIIPYSGTYSGSAYPYNSNGRVYTAGYFSSISLSGHIEAGSQSLSSVRLYKNKPDEVYYESGIYFIPDDPDDIVQYGEDSRVTNYNINLGTVYNGEVTNVYLNQTIINETNMTLTNPSTGTTYNITNWIYNYTDRSVSGETEDGDTYNVQFGDQYLVVSIDEDDYYYYYVIEQQVCDHHYVITDQTSPSCTASGSVTYTCSECGDTYTDTVPALGHNYQFVQSVPASGEDAGYDLFRCTRCGDEYTDSTFFNDDSDDANYWAWLKTWLQSFWNWLGDKLDAILDKDTTVNVDQDVNIDLPDVNIDFQYVDEAGEQQNWNPGELRSKFAFWKDVRDIGIELYDSVQPTAIRNGAYNPPELIIHLGAAESNYGVTYGGDEYAMDLSWYEPYKSTVDGIAGGFLWLLYLYGVWKHLPDIFSGTGMLENRMSDLQAGERHSRRRERD